MLDRVWEDQIAIAAQDEAAAFELLPPVAGIVGRDNWSVDLGLVTLPEPLDALIARDTAPLPVPADREGYFGERHYEYWLSGVQNHALTLDACARLGAGRDTYLELGCASGRTLRHFLFGRSFATHWGFDLNQRHVN